MDQLQTRNSKSVTRIARWRWIVFATVLVAIVSLTHCTRVQVKNTLTEPRQHLVWPQNGETPRIRFLANIASPDDLFVRRKWLGLADFLAGQENRSFAVPYDVHLTGDDVLLVTDPGKACVHFLDMRQHLYREVRRMGRQALEQPIGVAADENGQVYVSDSALGNVFVFNIRGEFLRPLTQPGTIGRPADLCYHAKTGLLYVADVTAHDVKVFRRDGTPVRTVGGRGMEPGKLNYPTHVWIEDGGTLFVTSAMDGAINVFGPAGEFLSSFGQYGDTPGFFSRPKGVATDRAGHLYVVDAIFDNVQIFDRRGSLLLPFGQAGSGAGELWLPAGIFIDPRDRIFVADQHNHRIAVFQYLEGGTQ